MTAPATELHSPNDSLLLRSLEEFTREHPLDRKRLIGPDVNFGRELLVTLARRTGGWVGWEATNLRGIAEALAFVPLAEREVRIADDVGTRTLVNRALGRAIASGRVSQSVVALASGLGFRRALFDTLMELRTAGVTVEQLRNGVSAGSPAHDLPALLAEYERLLREAALADPAEVFRAALDAFDREAPFVLDGVLALAPTRPVRGLSAELRARLLERGAQLLHGDEADDPGVPRRLVECARVDFFAAATPSDEVREICRRVMAEGLRWDEVEIVAIDPDPYGIALDALCRRLGFGATMLKGIPLARTRLGRALERWLGWLDDGLPADALRQALEAGELQSPDAEISSTALARELRALQVGWGRDRYVAAIGRLAEVDHAAFIHRREGESDEELARRRATRERVRAGLATLLRGLLDATPPVPERGDDRPVRSSCAALATATLGYLAHCPVHGQAEAQTMERLRGRLEALAAVSDEECGFSSALAALREALADLRAWPLVTSERKPWSAAGGMPHLTDVAHAGTTGRPRVFVVGFDAERTAGPGRQDPLLPDAARRGIAPDRLATSTEQREDSAQELASALATLRGRVTLSYAASGTLVGREAGPSPLMLQAWRLLANDPGLPYVALRDALSPPASAVPLRDARGAADAAAPLDERDVWLGALTDGPLLLDGTAAVREAFPVLAAGLDAHELANGDALTAHHGLVPDAGAALDPAAHATRAIAPSSLETLAKCPLAWFYRYGLSLHAVADPEYDAERWLDALQRGALLHELFEEFTRDHRTRQSDIGADSALLRMRELSAAAVNRWRAKVPPPGEAVFAAESAEIHRAASAFLQMERERLAGGDRGQWLEFELQFGSREAPASYALPNGVTLAVQGRVDRVDAMPDGTLRVVDYKTGRATPFARNPKAGAFNGGRQLQPAIYLAAVQALRDTDVSSFEYRFPTERGGNDLVAYDAKELEPVRGIVGSLLDQVRAGEFIPTNDSADCSYCNYQQICRASRGQYRTNSPRADWAKSHAELTPQYAPMLRRRALDGGQ